MALDYNPIVVPLDGSKAAENALPYAAWLARAAGGQPIRMVHVTDKDRVDGPDELMAAESSFARYALGLSAGAGIAEGDATVTVRTGNAPDAICDEAGVRGIIVMATHGRGGFKSAFVGSVADRVARDARVPVLLVPAVGEPHEPAPARVLVPLDGDGGSERALAIGREWAAALGSQVTLVRAETMAPATAGVEFAYYPPNYVEALEEGARAYLVDLARPGEEIAVVVAPPADAIIATAEKIDAGLVVMASSGKGLARRLVLGSTTSRVMHGLHRPLLVLPAVDDD